MRALVDPHHRKHQLLTRKISHKGTQLHLHVHSFSTHMDFFLDIGKCCGHSVKLNLRPCSQFNSGLLHNQSWDPARAWKKRLLHKRMCERDSQESRGGGLGVDGKLQLQLSSSTLYKSKYTLICLVFFFPLRHNLCFAKHIHCLLLNLTRI